MPIRTLAQTCPLCCETAQASVSKTAMVEIGDHHAISRRRICAACGKRWTSIEVPRDMFDITRKGTPE